ncbi:MAG: YodL domain-containing protein, partial [Acutalibacteraceae bacterium]|nr:YodL domain-containing protein [Acutalibacteraceae bacterium]
MRIYEQFEKNLSSKENAEFLKNEYGVGGGSHAGGHDGYSTWHDAKGLSITKGYDDNPPEVFLNWKQVATRIYQLVRMDRFLNPKEKEYYPKWLEEQAMKEAERLQREKEKANETPPTEQEYLYQYAVGDKVYLGSSEYEISLISNDGLVVLQDAHFPLVDKEMKREDFESLLKESIFNDHLKKPKSTHNRDLFIAYISNKLIDNQTIVNAYKNSDFENFKLEVNVAVDKLAIDLLVKQEAIDNLTVDEVREVIAEFQNIITVKETIYDTVSTNIDIALMQRNEVVEVDDIDFSDPFARNTDDELEPTAYDGIDTEDTETVQSELINSDGYTNYYRIYQLKDTPDYHGIRFQNSARNQKQGVKLNQDDYDLIYEGNWDELKDIPASYRLERIFEKFNTDLPEDFRGHSLSVSDVITVGSEDSQTAYYVDSVGFTDFPEFFKEKELEQVVDVEPLIQNNIPTITCISSEYPVFEYGKTYSLLEFDELMKNANIEWRRNRIEEFEMYSSSVEAIEATGRTYQCSARTEFKINMPDGSKYIARQDIYEGVGGVIDFLSQDSRYNDILPILKEQVAIERENTPILDVFDTAEIEERLTRIAQTIEADNADLIGKELKLDRHRYRVEKVSLFANVSLSNLDFEKEHGFPSTRVEKIDSVRNALKIQSDIELPQMIYQTDDNLNVRDVIHLENQEEPISNTQSVEQDNADLIGKELTLGNRRFRVEKISMFGDVSLRDLEFERVNGFPISRVEKVDFVRNALEVESAMEKTSTATKSVEELQIGDIIRLEGEEWRIDEIIDDFYFRIINQDENARCSRKAFIENWKERLIRLGYEYIPPVKESTRNIPTADKTNYIINDDNLGVGTKPERFQNNINAIRLLKAIESKNRLATQEEQEILSKYVGWGGLDKYFEPTHSRYNELRDCLTDDEFRSASESTLTAFY